jgi:ABC-type uncharacterized transport system permease subunit
MRLGTAVRSAFALGAAFALIAVIIAALGASPAIAFSALASGAFGNWLAFSDTLIKATPLIFCGLSVAIAFSGSLWNIGADGQLTAGAILAGAWGPLLVGWPHWIAIAVMLAAGTLGGAAWGGIAGWLRARRDVNEVISTIMLNFAAAQMLSWVVHGPLIESSRSFPESARLATSAQLFLYFTPSRLNAGILLAIVLAVGGYCLLFHTVSGFQVRALGRNRRAAIFFGARAGRITIFTMAMSGAIAGVGGAVQVSAITHRLYETLSPGWGYEAIAVALVARLNPLAIVPSAVLFGALDNGAEAMQRTAGISPVLVQVIQALVIMMLLAADRMMPRLWTDRDPTAETASERFLDSEPRTIDA